MDHARSTSTRLLAGLLWLAVPCLVGLTGCGGSGTHTADWVAAGGHGVGERSLMYVDATRKTPANGSFAGADRRTLPVELWYPTDDASPEDGPSKNARIAAGGPFPLIVHSHGLSDTNVGERYLAEHLARRGYLVAAPNFPLSDIMAPGGPTLVDVPDQPLDLRFVIDQLLADPDLGPAIDAARIGASGLSLGGLTTLLVAYHPTRRDPRIRAAFAMAPPACLLLPSFYATARVPLLVMQGDSDWIVPADENGVRAFDDSQAPSELVLLRHGTHTGFVGLATLLDADKHYDELGCGAIEGTIGADQFASFGDEKDGISEDPSVCPLPCAAKPMVAPLPAERQQGLALAAAAAFFDDTLRGDADAHRFVRERLAVENSADLSVKLK